MYVLAQISYLPEGALAVTEAKVLKYFAEPLDSSDTETRIWTCEMLGNMVFYGSTSVGVELCTHIVSLLRYLQRYIIAKADTNSEKG
jgi:hypothetical protein